LDGSSTNVAGIRSKEDVFEVWSKVQYQSRVTLWCDGLFQSSEKNKPSSKRVRDQSERGSDAAKKKQQG